MTVMMHDFVTLTIADVGRLTPDALGVTFSIPESHRAQFAFRPGQHVNVRTMIGDAPVERSYSICSDPRDPMLGIAIKRIGGGHFSAWAHGNLAPGMSLEVAPPAGRFALAAGDGTPRHLLAIAAGSGITPIICMVRYALATEPATRVTLIYGNRTPEEIIFREELEDLKDRHLQQFTLLHILSRGEMTDTPLLEGRIDGAKLQALAASIPLRDLAHVYLCGPGSMIKETRTPLFSFGVPRDRVHHEFFAAGGGAYRSGAAQGVARVAPADRATPPSHGPDTSTATGIEITLTLDGHRHRIIARPGETVIDAALRAGLRVPYACKGGMCCTCRAKILEGQAVMKVNYSLEAWEIEQGFTLTCQAVASTPRLALDYDQM